MLARREQRPLPDYRSVDLHLQAREEQPLPLEEYGTLREAVFEEERSHPMLLRQFHELTEPRQPPAERDLAGVQGSGCRLPSADCVGAAV